MSRFPNFYKLKEGIFSNQKAHKIIWKLKVAWKIQRSMLYKVKIKRKEESQDLLKILFQEEASSKIVPKIKKIKKG